MESMGLRPQDQLMKFIVGKWISKPIYVAAELGIADMLAEGPKNIQDLATDTRLEAGMPLLLVLNGPISCGAISLIVR